MHELVYDFHVSSLTRGSLDFARRNFQADAEDNAADDPRVTVDATYSPE